MPLPTFNPDKEPARPSFLHIEGVSPKDKAAWVKAAQLSHLKLADWVVETLNEESNRTQRAREGVD